jgi:hypothetical protein
MRTIVIERRQYDWKEIRRLRREQIQAARKPQLTLFELKDDARPTSQRSVEGRYTELLTLQRLVFSTNTTAL